MEKKRITFDIPLELHNRLKAEASAKGVSLGSYCSAILGGEAEASSSPQVDMSTLTFMSLVELREISSQLIKDKPSNWQRQVANVNMEMRRRFKI